MQQALDDLREEMDGLMDMGDIIRPEDVIAASGRLIGKGLEADQMATILSSMPTTGGQGLASWVRMHDNTVRQAEALTMLQNARTQSNMGIAALRSLAASHVEHEVHMARTGGPRQMGPPSHVNVAGFEPPAAPAAAGASTINIPSEGGGEGA
jgi:hypothetical protein